MKKNALLLAFGVAALGTVSLAQAQTCASPLTPTAPPQGSQVAGNSCGGTNSIGTMCGLFDSTTFNDVIYRFNVDATRTATSIVVTNTTPTWNARAIVLSGSCSPAAGCPALADDNGAGGNETLAVGSLAAGAYYLVIDTSGDVPSDACGSFTWAANGILPVQLTNFSID